MNERIQELMVELKKTVSTHRGDAVLIGYDEIEKFAELIIKDCIDNVKVWEKDSRNHISYMLKRQYGVEE